jgi:hypothetical protein
LGGVNINFFSRTIALITESSDLHESYLTLSADSDLLNHSLWGWGGTTTNRWETFLHVLILAKSFSQEPKHQNSQHYMKAS